MQNSYPTFNYLNMHFFSPSKTKQFFHVCKWVVVPTFILSDHTLCFSNQVTGVLYTRKIPSFCLFYLLCIFLTVWHMPFHFGYFLTDKHFSFFLNHSCQSFPLLKHVLFFLAKSPICELRYHLKILPTVNSD